MKSIRIDNFEFVTARFRTMCHLANSLFVVRRGTVPAYHSGDEVSKCKNCTLEELALLRAVASNPIITQKELADVIGKSERTVKTRTVTLQEKGYLRRESGKRNGHWEVMIELGLID